jgi:hypothetical protein
MTLYATITCDLDAWLTRPLGPLGHNPSGTGQNVCESLKHWIYVKKCYQDGLLDSHRASKEQPVRKELAMFVN